MKKTVLMIALATGIAAIAAPANAQMAVYDASNLKTSLKQVAHMVTQLRKLDDQLSNMRSQLDTAKGQLKSMTGRRGMERLVTETSRDYIPRDWREALAAGGAIRSLADDIRKTAGYLSDKDLESLNPAYRDALRKSGEQAINDMAASTLVFKKAGERFERLQVLMDEISKADDMKAIGELQVRTQVELAYLQNELIRAQSMASMIEQRREVELQKAQQKTAAESFKYGAKRK